MSEENKEVLEEDLKNSNEQAEEVVKQEEKSDLEIALEDLEKTKDSLKELREFDNYKKRTSKEKEMLYNSLVSDIITAFLPVIDNLEKAVIAETKDEEYKKGVELVLKQIMDVLASLNVQPINALGETFDPELHEAVSSIQDETKGEKEVVQDYRRGYKIGSKVIRHSMVVVAN